MNTPSPSLIEQRTGCIAASLKIVGDKWTALLLRDLATGPRRFSQLQTSLGGISPRTLSQRLESLVEHRIITKQAYAEMPPRVEYELTQKGRDLLPILQAMANWGLKHHSS
ncbi:MAG TPA: helix-turn-helix domain-containing protein [Candidatus Saccharimonadales bacterium]|nr:helix-turn-helix domain-containing protein [Candidatus Saccharimonadales bacterium]